MEDFEFVLVVSGVTYTLTVNECADDSPWIGEMLRGSLPVCWDRIVAEVADAHENGTDAAEAWLDRVLLDRLNFERSRKPQLLFPFMY